MTVITLATVGYGEVHTISNAGRIYTIVLIIIGVGFFLYVVGAVMQSWWRGAHTIYWGEEDWTEDCPFEKSFHRLRLRSHRQSHL